MSGDRLPISVCMIAGNEAARIRRALDSVSGWAAEIILVLNEEVADGTDLIARECGAKIFREPWKGHIAQKNSAAAKASQPWVLGLDADEVVSPELVAEIRKAVTGPENYAGYCFPRCTIFCGRWIRHGDWYPDRQTRLWRRGLAVWGGINPHDKLMVQGATGRMRGELLHYTAETMDHHVSKIMSHAEIFARDSRARQRHYGGIDLFVRPAWRFFRGYFFRLGFLDGWQGCYIAWLTAFYTATRYAKVRAGEKNT